MSKRRNQNSKWSRRGYQQALNSVQPKNLRQPSKSNLWVYRRLSSDSSNEVKRTIRGYIPESTAALRMKGQLALTLVSPHEIRRILHASEVGHRVKIGRIQQEVDELLKEYAGQEADASLGELITIDTPGIRKLAFEVIMPKYGSERELVYSSVCGMLSVRRSEIGLSEQPPHLTVAEFNPGYSLSTQGTPHQSPVSFLPAKTGMNLPYK